MLTVTFTQVLYFICWRWDEVTGGEAGLKGIVRTSFLGVDMTDPYNFYYFVFILFALSALVIRRIADSSLGGLFWRSNRTRSGPKPLAIIPGFYKFAVYMISGFFADWGEPCIAS